MKENLYTTDCIRTHSGLYMNVFQPTPEMINIDDIAHSLAQMPRFGGHLPIFYSVAQHSICAALHASGKNKLVALLHDASEAYMMDMPRPIKQRMGDYKIFEENLMKVIAHKFGFEWPMPEEVKDIDRVLLHNEWNEYMLAGRGKELTHKEIKDQFLLHFKNYSN